MKPNVIRHSLCSESYKYEWRKERWGLWPICKVGNKEKNKLKRRDRGEIKKSYKRPYDNMTSSYLGINISQISERGVKEF